MSSKNTGRKSSGLVISRNPTWLSANDGLLVAGVSGKSIAICDVLISSGSGKKLGTGTNGTGTLIAHVSSGSSSVKRPIRVPEGESVYTDASAYITVTYYETDEMSGDIINPTGEGLHDWQGEECPLGNLLTFKTADGFTDWQANKFYKIIYPNDSFDCVEGSTITALGTYASTNSYTHGLWDVFNSCDSCESSTPAVTTTPSPTTTTTVAATTTTTVAATTTTTVAATTTTTVAAAASNACVAKTSGNEYYWNVDSTFTPVVGANATHYSRTQYVNTDGTLWLAYNGTATRWKINDGVNEGGSEWYESDNDGTNPWDAAWTNAYVGVTEKANATHCYPAGTSNFCIAGQGYYEEYEGTWVPYNTYNGKAVWWNQIDGNTGTPLLMWYDSTNSVWKINDYGWEPHGNNGYSSTYNTSDGDGTNPWDADWSTEISAQYFDSINSGDC